MAVSPCCTVTDRQGRELVSHGTPLFPVACYNDDFTVDSVPWHWHDELELILVETGTVMIAVEGVSVLIEQGSGCFINTGVLHSVCDAGQTGGRLHSVVFQARLVGGSMDSIFWHSYLQPLLLDTARRFVVFEKSESWNTVILQAVEEAWQFCALEPPGYEFLVREALSKVVFLLTKHRPPVQKPPSEKTLREAERTKVMLQYIQEHCDERLTVQQIARSASVSESECLRCFRGIVGTTPIQYLKQLRIQKAAELLLQTDKKIAEIGGLCGFQEMSYFAKAFRALKGCTPGEYRKQRG